MGATRVQTKAGNSGDYVTAYSFTFDSSTVSGNTLIIGLSYNDDQAGTPTVTDNKGNSFTKRAGGSSGGDTTGETWVAENITGGASHQITVTFSANYHDSAFVAREFSGLETASFDVKAEGATASGTSHTSATTSTTAQANELVVGVLALAANSTFSLGSGFSNLSNANSSDLYEAVAMEDKDVTATGTQQATMTSGATTVGYFMVLTFKEAETAAIEQEGFAFGTDDGNEASHTLGTQDANVTAPLGTKTLRLLLNTPDDPAAAAFKLKFQKNGAGGFATVPVGSVTPGQTGAIEVGDITGSGNNTASNSWAVSHPAAATGDLLIFNIGWDDSTATTGLTAPAGKNGETAILIEDVVASSSTSVRGKVVAYKCTGSWSAGTLTFTPSASEQWQAGVIKIPAGEFDATTPIGADASLASTTTGNPTTPAFSAGASDGGGRLVAFIVGDADNPDGNASGWTDRGGNDVGAVGVGISTRDALVTDSESISAASGWTFPTARDWVTFCYIVRPPADVTNELYISTSANVTAGGEATTARLTAPSGKTTSDFDTGRRWDNENGTDTIDITAADYTEIEWILTTQSTAATDDYFEFRVYNGDAALDTYTVTPKWTIGSGGVEVTPALFGGDGAFIAPTITTGAAFSVTAFSLDGVFIAPTVTGGAAAAPSLFGGEGAFIAPGVIGGVNVAPALFGGTAGAIAATVTTGAAVSVSLFGGSGAVIEPTTTGGAAHTPVLFGAETGFIAPTVTTGAALDINAFATVGAFIAPSITTGAAFSVSPFGSVAGFFAPTVTTQTVVTPDLFGHVAGFFAPTVTGGVGIAPSVFGHVAGFIAPTVTTGALVNVSIFGNNAAFFAPAVTGGANDTPELFGAGAAFYSPSIIGGVAAVPSLFGSVAGFFAPTVTAGGVISPSLFGGNAALVAPTVTTGAAFTVTLFGSSSGFFAPGVSGGVGITPALFGSGSGFYAPTIILQTSVFPALFGSHFILFAPTVTGGVAVTAGVITASAGIIAPTVVIAQALETIVATSRRLAIAAKERDLAFVCKNRALVYHASNRVIEEEATDRVFLITAKQ